jgi:4-carboxymuconolactone decarboxylase
MTRLPYVEPALFTPEQRELYDSIVSGPRAGKRGSLVDAEGHLTGPFNGFLRLPALGKHWSAIGETLRFRTRLERKLFELAVLVVAAEWRCGHEWAAHSGLARDAGLNETVIAALQAGATPEFGDSRERVVFEFVRELSAQRRVADRTYAVALDALGAEQLTELVHTVAYYTALAAMLNAFAVKPPVSFVDPWPVAE